MNPQQMNTLPIQKQTGPLIQLIHKPIAQRTILAFTDASIRKTGSGVGIVTRCSDDEYSSTNTLRAKHLTAYDINELELSAIFLAFETIDKNANLVVYTDSETAIWQMTGKTPKKKYKRMAELALESAESRNAAAFVCKVKAHAGNRGNELADALAAEGTRSAYIFEFPRDGDDLGIWRAWHVEDKHALCIFSDPK
jgi:ribonuclease HI